MSDEAQLGALAELVGRFAGIQLPPPKHWYLEGRVKVRMERTGVTTLRDYVDLVKQDRGRTELGLLVEALRVGETRFFRHGAQVTALRRVVIPDLEARKVESGARIVRAWSAGCATGEEPYTVAMLLDDALPITRGFRHEILATDISEEALAVAQAGRFDATALRTVPAQLRSRYFVEDDDAFRVSDRLRAIVRFEKKNLQDPIYPRGFDLILCRNVLIYFDRVGRDRVISRLAESLVPGGWVFLGYSESLRGSEDHFDAVRTDEGTLYRRRLDDGSVPRATRAPGGSAQSARPRTGDPAARAKSATDPPRATRAPADRTSGPQRARQSSDNVRPRRRAITVPGPGPAIDAAPPPSPIDIVKVEGSFGDDARGSQSDLAARLQPALASSSPTVVVDLEGAQLLGDAAARVLSRARRVLEAEGRLLLFICRRPGVVRWIRRHRLDGSAPIAADAAEALRIAGEARR